DGIRDYKVTGVQTCALPISQCTTGHKAFPIPNQTLNESGKRRAFGSSARRACRSFQIRTGVAGALFGTKAWGWIVEGRSAKSREIGRASCRERVEMLGVGGA